MDHPFSATAGSSQAALIDQDIAHIGRVMRPSLHGDLRGPILSAGYWRKRLHELLDSTHLSHAQMCSVDSLLLQLDRFDASSRDPQWGLPSIPAMVSIPQAQSPVGDSML
jgi:hypothetical protein